MSYPPALKREVANRGSAPDSFLAQVIGWARSEDDAVFAPNDNPADIYALIALKLGPWAGLAHRRAAMCEAMRVHAGFEASWNWNEDVDATNRTSQQNRAGRESGIFQDSFNSTALGHAAMLPFAQAHGIGDVESFIAKMKSNHRLALSYYARLVRVNIQWAGPLASGKILSYLSRDSVTAFEGLV